MIFAKTMSHYRAPLPHFNFKSKIEKCDEEFQKNGNFKRINNRKNNEIRDMCNYKYIKNSMEII